MPVKYGSFPCAVRPNRKGLCMPKTNTKPAGTDWNRVKREAAKEAPIPFDAAVEPYNPNDAAAVDAYWKSASISMVL